MAFVADWCDRNGLCYEVTALDPDRPNIIVSVGDPNAGPTIAMNGHLDTVTNWVNEFQQKRRTETSRAVQKLFPEPPQPNEA